LPHRADLGQPAEVRIYAPMGGEAFSLTAKGPTSSGEALLTWSPATVQPRYELSRLTPSGVTTLQISGGSTSAFVDGIPVGTPWACYQLASIDALGATAAKSDELCELPGTGFGTPPDQFTIQLNQSPTASLSWKSVAGASNILVVPLGTSRLQVLPGSATSTQDATGGSLTCYGLADLQGASLAGNGGGRIPRAQAARPPPARVLRSAGAARRLCASRALACRFGWEAPTNQELTHGSLRSEHALGGDDVRASGVRGRFTTCADLISASQPNGAQGPQHRRQRAVGHREFSRRARRDGQPRGHRE